MEWLGLVTVSVCLIVSDCFLWTDQICFLLGPEITLYSNMSGIVLIRFTSRRTSDGLWPSDQGRRGGDGSCHEYVTPVRPHDRNDEANLLPPVIISQSPRSGEWPASEPRTSDNLAASESDGRSESELSVCQRPPSVRDQSEPQWWWEADLASEMSGHSDLPWPRVTWPRSWVWPRSSWGWRGWVAPTTPPPTMPTPRGSPAAQVGIME